MPATIHRTSKISRTDTLVDYLKSNSDLEIIYPKDELLAEAGQYQLYYKYDTHWNSLGAYIGVQHLVELISGTRSYLDDEKIISYQDTKAIKGHVDLAVMMDMQDYFDDDYFYEIPKYSKYSINSKTDSSVLLVGDSFRTEMSDYIPYYFYDNEIVSRDSYNSNLLNEKCIDILILEYVERYSDGMEDFSLIE